MIKSSIPLFVVLAMFSSQLAQAQSDYENILIEEYNGSDRYQPCEPSIAISQTNSKYIVAGSILDKVYTSSDTGRTWTIDRLESVYGVFGDPCIVASPKGGFFYFHLSNPDGKGWESDGLLDRIVCQYSKNQGKSWSKGAGIGLDEGKDQDKEWAATSLDGKCVYSTWTQFDSYGSKEEGDSTLILFSKGNRKGERWTEPQRISQFAGNCLDGDRTVEGAVPCVGPNGEIYVSWALGDTIWFDRSLDEGKTWLKEDLVAAEIIGGWDMKIPGVNRANGMPVTACDRSGGEHQGTIYINWADQRNGVDNTDIWLASSKDGGATWSDAVKVNDDEGESQQYFTWMDVDQSNGRIYVVFYDRRNHEDNETDVYLAYSDDGGKSFVNERISASSFSPNAQLFFGDYNNISVHNGIVRPIWTRHEKGRLSIWTALINHQ